MTADPNDPALIRDARLDAIAAVRSLLVGDGEALAVILNHAENHRELAHAAIGIAASVMTVLSPETRAAILHGWMTSAAAPDGGAV